ncbi:diacylglycerol kinase family protein [Streptomyces sp. NPDC021093]|uniref:diacylglycerol kinase family protein n=1 Tax=Streptomyces sp. NPDC021093 TaxID=3365112 RepID=UPI0037BC865A
MVVIDPVARRMDGESVRIAKDVLCAGARAKICLPETPEEFARALSRRGSRRPVVIGDDRALLRTVGLLHRERELADGGPVGVIPVGQAVSLARSLGVPADTVAAARAVLDGTVRRLDLLVDDSDGVVLGGLRVPGAVAAAPPSAWSAWSPWTACRSFVRTLVRPAPLHRLRTYPLRVEADGVLLSDLDEPVEGVSVRARGGRAEVVVVRDSAADGVDGACGADGACDADRANGAVGSHRNGRVTAEALTVTISGPDFRYRADEVVGGPVRTRTWTVREGAWGLVVPRAP